jgi:SAM-dependent methyltransferase
MKEVVRPMADVPRCCFICGSTGRLAYESNIDPALLSEFTYSSRKIPELMHYEYFECESCELLFASDMPKREELLAEYEGAAFDATTESRFAAQAYLRALLPILSQGVDSVLDVGCGDGEFLLACRDFGITRLMGIEPSTAASSLAREGIGRSIRAGGYEELSGVEQLDLITLFQTIEHIDDPLGFLAKTKELVRPGGYVAVACHDYHALVNRIMGEHSPIFDIEHLQVFSTKSITRVMDKAGLEVVSVKPYSNTYPFAYWMRLAPVPRRLKVIPLFKSGLLAKMPVRLPIGNLMAIAKVPDAEGRFGFSGSE